MWKKWILASLLLLLATTISAAPINILYMNSTRGSGTGSVGNIRDRIANTLNNYQGGSVFNVDFVQSQTAGDLSSKLNSQTTGFYNQIWFDSTILNTQVLNGSDLSALNTWAANKQPEFILDSSYFARTRGSTSNGLSASAAAVTINEALALKNVGGGILIGTDHNSFAHTANQVLTNFGFDNLFTGSFSITADGSFVGELLLSPETVGADFFTTNLQSLSTSNVPIGTHTLNANGGNRTIEIVENLFSNSPGHVSHIGASFSTGDQETQIDDVETFVSTIPEPSSILLLSFAGFLLLAWRRR